MDAGFYRGTSADQDNRFGDKEKKLLKQMKFEAALDQKVDMSKVNLEVVKPWITGKLNEILGVEDDVVIEYVFTLLEGKDLNPKVMQINLTGFLNARRAREFVGELWAMLVEAQSSTDGIPSMILEKKMQELKASGSGKFAEPPLAKVISNDWKHRYQSLTGGRYGKVEPNYESQPMAFDPNDKSERIPETRGRRHDDRDRRGDRWDRDRERDRDRDRHHRENRDRDRSRDRTEHHARKRTPSRSPPPMRKSKDEERKMAKRHHSSDEASDAGSDREVKKKKKKAHRHSDDSDSERERKKAKKHKKEKKEKKEKKKKREKEESD